MNGNNDHDDADIADLVDDNGNGKILEMAPLNSSGENSNVNGRSWEGPKRNGLEEAGMLKPGGPSSSSSNGDIQLNCCSPLGSLICAYIIYTCDYAPRTCWTIGILLLLISSYLLIVGVLANPTEHFGVIQNDFSDIQSMYDFKMKDIDHWCLKGDNDSCPQCQDPLQPTPRNHMRIWTKTQAGNVETVNRMVDAGMGNPDIAFLGGTVVEAMDGKWFGNMENPHLKEVAKFFDSYFSHLDNESTDEDKLTAVSLGIVGDTNPSVLWRILNGEMPPDFNPKIWWLELGMNDLGFTQCSEEVVVLGVLRVVEEILQQKSDSKIVINSLFPMAQLRQDEDLETSWGPRNKPRKGGVARMKVPDGVVLPSPKDIPPNGGSNNGKNMIKRPNKKDETDDNGNQRGLKSRILRDGRRPIKLNDHKLKQHKFNAITHRENKLPLWTSIVAVNRELKRFCNKHDERVYFHDVTNIFTERGERFATLKTDMITPKGLPTEPGYDAWMTSIVTRAKFLLNEGDER